MNKESLREVMNGILKRKGLPETKDDAEELRAVGFRSLDFSEMALRVEKEAGRELNFDAALMRSIQTVGDVLYFFENATKNNA
jgi:acyl carrier protein